MLFVVTLCASSPLGFRFDFCSVVHHRTDYLYMNHKAGVVQTCSRLSQLKIFLVDPIRNVHYTYYMYMYEVEDISYSTRREVELRTCV